MIESLYEDSMTDRIRGFTVALDHDLREDGLTIGGRMIVLIPRPSSATHWRIYSVQPRARKRGRRRGLKKNAGARK